MAIPLKLQVFEGPMDLLMHLIEKNKIDIYDIPIVTITDQYLEYVRQMEHSDMNVTSEFLVMAATLLDIKSRMLLPREEDEEGEEEDPRDELVRRLLEYKMYKFMSEELREKSRHAGLSYFREQAPHSEGHLQSCVWWAFPAACGQLHPTGASGAPWPEQGWALPLGAGWARDRWEG